MAGLRNCRCGAAFLPRHKQQFCSRSCASKARPRQAAKPAVKPSHLIVLRMLEIQPLERRTRGGWRFGTRAIGESLVAGLIASGHAEIRGAQLHPTEATCIAP